MGSRVRFVTHVTHTLGDKWQWTKPRKTPRESFEAAENMVSARLMEDRSIKRNFENFAVKLRVLFPEIIEEAQAFIGETREGISTSCTPPWRKGRPDSLSCRLT